MIRFSSLFQNNFPKNVQTKIDPEDSDPPRRILYIHSAEVSDLSEVPRFVREIIFKVIKEVKLVSVRSIISCSHVPSIF